MGDNGIDIPTTDAYEINLDVDIHNPLLAESFNDAVFGTMDNDTVEQMIKVLVSRDGLEVSFSEDERSFSNSMTNEINIGLYGDIARFLAVTPDNLPPSMPESFTNELYLHLVALHEAEHMSQHSYDLHPESGEINVSTIKSNLVLNETEMSTVGRELLEEADSDNAVLEHLDDMGQEDASQFWLDMRMAASFTHRFAGNTYKIYEHDTSSILSHYRETGDIIDVDQFVEQKGELMAKIQREVLGADMKELMAVMAEYPQLSTAELRKLSDVATSGQEQINLTPQRLMHTVKGLLESGELDGLQKWEAQNYLKAVERLGYEADASPAANFSMVDKVRDIMENDMGKTPLNATPATNDPASEIITPAPVDVETFKL
ncbi:MAG: hypothetical protein ACRBCK_01570 [Alphaproteobacteria bacterium]